MASLPKPPAQPDDNPESYVGLTSDEAERTATEHGWSTVRTLAPGAIITMEFLHGRLNFEAKDGRVTRCWIG
ncbi:I78 family peptidase inhibitor [Streptomyces sp. NBC_00237]|uniref:I78 family peptidase inhibitor n=1 Tax=Streptomyces sp. NBC_00237 TaxID=2975687 RepID=UPI00225A51EF|nr:I78 family peptidase inhibitor [Streptomyces sp. NBC_00237]MCX5202166.1 I78 family peptidase inhibitor [Streptomyces sp. NBC_00237]